MSRLFTIGKVIQIRSDPLRVTRLAFIETEEHIRHVVEMLTWLYPDASEKLRQAARLHDIGKKVYLQYDFARKDKRLSPQRLLNNFYQPGSEQNRFTPDEAIQRYLAFLKRGHAKCSIVRQNPEDENSQIVAARYQLDPPFGQHAATLDPSDLRGLLDNELGYVHSLIQLHHNFQVDKLVATAAEYGEGIITDLHRLITADQEASRWAEFLVQKLEGGEEEPEGKFRFSEFAIEPVADPKEISRDGAHVQAQVTLKASRCPALDEWTLPVDYYVSDCDFLTPDLATKKRGGKKR
ncbi:hypothetical protein [Thermodesulfitimonas autotrophica]|uniref:hypothetical protein n=1 Tax=Thermodesulfitimonas autotrophica TaxID=1894989 RepID=UPI002FDF9FBF